MSNICLKSNGRVAFQINNLNSCLKDKKLITHVFKVFKDERKLIFPRRYGDYCDFVNLTVLFLTNQLKISTMFSVLVKAFQLLPKRRHHKFIEFFKKYILFICTMQKRITKRDVGIKLIIQGKVSGHTRAQKFIIKGGKFSLQKIVNQLHYAKFDGFTRYGVFGFSVWYHVDIK